MRKAIEHIVQRKVKKAKGNYIRKPLTGMHKRTTNFSSFVSSKLTSRKASRSDSKSRSNLRKQFENWRKHKNLSCFYEVDMHNKLHKPNSKLTQSRNLLLS